MKIALLGTAALAAVSVSARAENLDALKAQIEALNARVATLEATPAVPAGYSLVSFAKGQDLTVPGYYEGNKNVGAAHVISVIPSADAPAAASAVITWSGWVRGMVITGRNVDNTVPATVSATGTAGSVSAANTATSSQYATDVRVRGEIVVSGKTDTAVGEVGARVALETSGGSTDTFHNYNGGNGAVTTDGFWGWWKMTPNLTLGAGVDGSLSKNSKGFDATCTCYYYGTGGSIGTSHPNDPAQIRLSYADGPLGFAIAVEDGNNTGDASAFGVAAKATWAGDMFSADLSGGYIGNSNTAGQAAWVVDAGIGANLGSMASISAAVGIGSGLGLTDDYTKASAILKLSMADTAHAEIGIGHTWNTQATALDSTTIGGGIYYDPVKQLTIGAEGSYVSGGTADGAYVADLVTVFRF
jgi:hypothetical protein